MVGRLKGLLIDVEYHAHNHFVTVYLEGIQSFQRKKLHGRLTNRRRSHCNATRRSFKTVFKRVLTTVFWLLKQTHKLPQGLKDTTTHRLCDGV
ncbi:hypothetical protein TNIN_426541 [Trichonephila inaurata madagascariensis]|uniref:Uncharacterized protein n=1 Tax=Trichonephila inaurata madagascariensis TaxID=2747483 RepID=A0A8X6XF18_9ARAC|nr:hypothetical protein TNIN_426541 [Trichonephila inaurata madagascariensis]